MDGIFRVLHLDPDAAATGLAQANLSTLYSEIEIDCVDRFEAFMDALARHRYALVLSGWGLPGGMCRQSLEHVRREEPGLPFIVFADESIGLDEAVHAVKLGADDVVFKNRPGRLAQAVRGALEAHKPVPEPENIADANRRKDEMLGMLVHELRNPLAPMRSALEVLRLIGAHDPALKHHTEIIDRQIGYQARLIGDLFDISRILEGRMEISKQSTDLNDVLTQAVELSLPPLELRRHKLTMNVPPMPLRVEADPDRLVQAIGALLSNSVKFTEQGGQIWLEASVEDDQAVIKVRDTGMGMLPEMLPRIFELPIELGRDRSRDGLGVGLTLVKQIVELHNGTIEARSEGLGRGSEFVIRLPMAGEERVAGKPRAAVFAPAWSPMRRILVVDDVADSAESLADLLILWGHDIQTAHDGPTAIKVAHAFQPEVVLLDIAMPGMDGYEVARKLREMEECADALLVAMTGYGQEEDRNRALDAGFDRHLTKPVDLEELQKLLTSF
ncbi:MAG: response regulator [Candidatus Sumerlaeia bacterium]